MPQSQSSDDDWPIFSLALSLRLGCMALLRVWRLPLMMQPDDPLAITLLVTRELERLDIPYFIGGSLAAVFYGEYRSTRDADIVAKLQLTHAQPFTQALEHAFFMQAEDIHETIRAASQFRNDPQYRPSFNL